MNATGAVFSKNNGKSGVESSTAQYPHPMFPPWPIHSPPGGMPPFQGYPMQGMPYYPNYPRGSPFFQQPYPSMEDPRHNFGKRIQKRHSMDSRESHSGSDTWEIERSKSKLMRSWRTEIHQVQNRERRVVGQVKESRERWSYVNYITSKRENSSGSDSQSHSGSEEEVEDGDTEHKNSRRSSKVNGSRTKSVDAYDREEAANGKDTDGGHWQAFQTYLLKDAEEEECRTDREMFQGKRRPNRVRGSEDPLVFRGREMGQFEEGNATDMHEISASGSRMPRGSNDQSSTIGRGGHAVDDGRIFIDGEMDGRRVYRRNINDGFIVERQQNLSDFTNSPSDLQTFNRFERSSNGSERRSSNNINYDSYIIPFRSTSVTQLGTDDRSAIHMDSDFSLSLQKAENIPSGIGSQAHVEDGTSLSKKNKEGTQGSKKSEKDRKSKLIADPSDKKKAVGPIRRGKPSKPSPLDEAKVRAERLRTYKADLQKLKKEKEDAEIKRLEALKMERQKRIAARGGSIPAQSSVAAQSSKHLPSPSSHKASKFTDGEPGPSSPLQRSIKPASVGSAGSHKASKPSKLNTAAEIEGDWKYFFDHRVTEPSRNKEEVSLHADGDDSTVVEKTVVMLESVPAVNSSKGTTVVKKGNDGIFKIRRETEMVSDSAAVHAPVSSLNPQALDKEQIQQKQRAYEAQKANISDTEKELLKFTSASVTGKKYQAPLARVSSVDDPCTEISEYIPEVLDVPQVKDSSKGFRRLLKFGKKNHNSARSEHSIDLSSEAEELVPNAASSSEESDLPGRDPDSRSRSFSLLSSFRSKTSEKKYMAGG
ncbi:COP1-interacting protein-related, putative isoform 3 [Hibiscus syriacus]|uniref:COP1-interacting protein-related, putative isoform 3 n=1 Tax=Hibiscus syriacus TaxID=106335 RepID=A0A6A3BPA4_HIBSY|nr:COP1-interacting protein-related, putative isoform 3 [Hibiscus syriacus]